MGNNVRLKPGVDDLAQWNEDWILEGDHLDCKVCGFSQWPKEAQLPFIHKPTCRAVGAYDQFPWRDLAWIIQHMKIELDEK